MSDVRIVTFEGQTLRFWLAPTDAIVRLPALYVEGRLGRIILEDPASRGHVDEYPERELIELLGHGFFAGAWGAARDRRGRAETP